MKIYITILPLLLPLSASAQVALSGLGGAARIINFGDTTTVVTGTITTSDSVNTSFSYQVIDWGTAVAETNPPAAGDLTFLFQGSGRFEVNAYGNSAASNYSVGVSTGPTVRVTFGEALSLQIGQQDANGIRNDSTGLLTTTSVTGTLSDTDNELVIGSTAADLDINGDLTGADSDWVATFGDFAGQTTGATTYDFQFNWDSTNAGTHVEAFQIKEANTVVVPEPASSSLLGLGALMLMLNRSRKN